LNKTKLNVIGFRIINSDPSQHSTSIHIIRVPKHSSLECKSSSIVLKSSSINAHENKDNIFIHLLKVRVNPKEEEKIIIDMISNVIIKLMNYLSNDANKKGNLQSPEDLSTKNNTMTICFEAWSPKKLLEFNTGDQIDVNNIGISNNLYDGYKQFYTEKLSELIKSEKEKNIMIFISENKVQNNHIPIIHNKSIDDTKLPPRLESQSFKEVYDKYQNVKNENIEVSTLFGNEKLNNNEPTNIVNNFEYIIVPKITIISASKDEADDKLDIDKIKKRRESRRPISTIDRDGRRKSRIPSSSSERLSGKEKENRNSRSRERDSNKDRDRVRRSSRARSMSKERGSNSNNSKEHESPKLEEKEKDQKPKGPIIIKKEKGRLMNKMGQKTYRVSQLATNILTISDSDSENDNNEKEQENVNKSKKVDTITEEDEDEDEDEEEEDDDDDKPLAQFGNNIPTDMNINMNGINMNMNMNGMNNMNDINLNGMNLNGINMNGMNLNGMNLNGMNMNGMNMNGMNLNGMNLNGMNLNGMNLNGVNLDTMNLNNMNLNNMNLNNMNLNNMNLNNMNLNGMNMNDMNMNGMNMSDMNMNDMNMNMNSMNLNSMLMNNMIMNGINMNGMNMYNINMGNMDINDINMNKANINMNNTNISNSNMNNSNKDNSIKDNSIKDNSNMNNSKMDNSNMDNSNIKNTSMNDNTNIKDSNINNMNIKNADMNDMNIKNANINDINIESTSNNNGNNSNNNSNDNNMNTLTRNTIYSLYNTSFSSDEVPVFPRKKNKYKLGTKSTVIENIKHEQKSNINNNKSNVLSNTQIIPKQPENMNRLAANNNTNSADNDASDIMFSDLLAHFNLNISKSPQMTASPNSTKVNDKKNIENEINTLSNNVAKIDINKDSKNPNDNSLILGDDLLSNTIRQALFSEWDMNISLNMDDKKENNVNATSSNNLNSMTGMNTYDINKVNTNTTNINNNVINNNTQGNLYLIFS